MNRLKFKQIIYLISITVVLTVAAQVYTNVQNYHVNKQRFEKDHSIRKAISSVETEIDSTSIFCLEQDNVQSIKFFNQGSVDDLKEIQLLTKKILSSLTTRSIDLDRLDNHLESELERKGIDVGYQLVFTTPNKVHLSNNKKDYSLTTFSKSTMRMLLW